MHPLAQHVAAPPDRVVGPEIIWPVVVHHLHRDQRRLRDQFVHLLRLLPACDLPVKVPEGVLGRKTNAEAGKTSQNLTSRRASTSLDSTAKRKQLTQLAGQNRPSDVDRQVGRVEGLDRVWATRQAAQTILAAQGVVLNLNVLDENR